MNSQESLVDEVKELVQRHWNRRAPDFDAKPNHGLHTDAQREAWLAVLRRLTGPRTLQVLDVGCGTGFLTLLFAELGHRVTGVDLAPDMLAIAREKASRSGLTLDLRLGDAERLELPDTYFDLVVARHLIWTLPNPSRAVREWLRVLKSGGRLALVEGHWENQTIQAEYEQIRGRLPFYGGLPSDQLATFLRSAGLDDVVVEPLMDAVLWGDQPTHPRYLVVAAKAETAR